MNSNLIKLSKFLSLILRHKPETIELTLDENGWADVAELIYLANKHNKTPLTQALLKEIVVNNDKQRFAFNEDKSRIRANQGHSITIDLDLIPQTPPDILYHGTATRFIESIRDRGLIAQSRQHVHLSLDKETAIKVGSRHGKPVVLNIWAAKMHLAGFEFFRSNNGVWLTKQVPVEYIEFPSKI
jgi:putative RNA 2'-phosphotransferase